MELVILALLLDRSASMAYDSKMTRAKKLALSYFQNLGEDDKTCIVSVDHITEVLLPPSSKKDAPNVGNLIEGIRDRGNTNLALGLKKVSEIIAGEKGRVVLLSDGRANTSLDGGGTEGDELVENEMLRLAGQLSKMNVSVSTISLGEDAFTTILEELTQATGGESLTDVGGRLEKTFDLRDRDVTVYPVPEELPSGKPTWTKELNIRHVTVASKELCSEFKEKRLAFLLNPKSNRRARVSLLAIDDAQLAPFRSREPGITKKVSDSSVILVDRTYRRVLGLHKGDDAHLRICDRP